MVFRRNTFKRNNPTVRFVISLGNHDMWLRLHPPFTGRPIKEGNIWTEITLSEPLEVEVFLQKLEVLLPRLVPYLRPTSEETFYHILLVKKGYVLKPRDMVDPDDRIEVLMPLTGG